MTPPPAFSAGGGFIFKFRSGLGVWSYSGDKLAASVLLKMNGPSGRKQVVR